MPNQDLKQVNYRVSVTKRARKQGEKLKVSNRTKLEIIKELKQLKYWSVNEEDFEYESAFGAIEFKFDVEGKWVRVFVFQDDYRKTMWVIKVLDKKQNDLKKYDQIGIETAVSALKREVLAQKKIDNKESSKKKTGLNIVKK